MPIFILLSTLTQQGVQTLKSNPERLLQVNKDVEELGCKVLHQWATLGEFDFINVVEAPDIASVAKVSIALSARSRRIADGAQSIEVVRVDPDLARTSVTGSQRIPAVVDEDGVQPGSDACSIT
jgi:uncharacterized protein with GYD domain